MSDIECIRSQNDEYKALENIYLDEFHPVKESHPQKFNILCFPYKSKQAEYQLKIMFEFTSNYPKSPLKYDIEPVTGLTRDNVISIANTIDDIIDNNRDRPVVYDIVEDIRAWIQLYLVEGKAYETEDEVKAKKEEFFERPKFAAFTPVTIESFTAWKKEFELQTKQQKVVEKKEGEEKISGREWFMGKREDEIEDDDEDLDDEDYDEDEEIEEEEVEERMQGPREENNDLF